MTSIVIISVSGIGSTLLTLPMIKQLRKKKPDWTIDLLCGQKGSVDLLKDNEDTDNVIFFNRKILKNFLENVKLLYKLYSKKYDYSIIAFPGNRIAFNLFSFLIHAKKRLAHSYQHKKFKSGSFLNTKKIKMEEVHDIENNLNILKLLDIDIHDASRNMELKLSNVDMINGAIVLEQKNITFEDYVCIHPGCSKDQPYKRLSYLNYALIIEELIKKYEINVMIITGPDEREVYEEIIDYIDDCYLSKIIDSGELDLRTIAALMKMSSLSITNDSGLMHIATAVGANIFGIYGASDPKRTKPYNLDERYYSADLECQPCNRTLKNLGCSFKCKHSKYLKKNKEYKCLDSIDLDDIMKKIGEKF